MTQLQALRDLGDKRKAEEMAAYHKAERLYLGVANPVIDALVRDWRKQMDLQDRLDTATELWNSDIHEARIAAAKLLTQARIRPDEAVWKLISAWVREFDAWAIADHACSAGARRLSVNPARLDEVESWTRDENKWVRRAALVMTLPWTKSNHPSQEELAQRDRILGWAASYVDNPDWFIQKSVAWWLRSLSRHDAARTRAFLDEYGPRMKNFARKDAARHLPSETHSD